MGSDFSKMKTGFHLDKPNPRVRYDEKWVRHENSIDTDPKTGCVIALEWFKHECQKFSLRKTATKGAQLVVFQAKNSH